MLRNPIIGALVFIFLLIAVNLLWLDIIVFSRETREPAATTTTVSSSCDQTCRHEIAANILQTIQLPQVTPTQTKNVSISAPVSSNEYYIPLGAGTTKSAEYVDLNGAEAYIDTTLYGPIKQVTFEVFLRNPTGNGRTYAKLFNVTDKHDVWFSEVYFEGGGLARKEATISLEPGNKLYRVKLKSTLAYDVYVDNARVRIVTQ